MTFAPQPGVTFTRWTGDVSDENAVKPSFTFAIEDMTTIGLQFDAGFFHFENGLLTDGVQSFKATKSDAGYAVSGAIAMRTDGLLDLDKSDAEGLGIVSIGTGAFSGNTAITRLVLPDGLQSLGSTAFKSCSKIVDVVNFLPRGLTWIGNESFGGCSSITNVAWIGYGTNDLGEAIGVKMDNSSSGDRNSCLFNGCSKLPAIHYGPGVVTVERYAVNSCSSLREIEMSVNTITNREYYAIASGITNVICLTTNVMNFTCQNQGTFNGCYNLRQIVFNGWFKIACGGTFMTVSDRNCRFVVPGDNMDWLNFIGDGTRVEPWANLSDADRTYYTNRYGEDENLVPCGLTYAVGGQYGRVWVVKTKVQLAGCPLTVVRPNAAFGTLTVTPEPSAETGLYAPGTEVTVSIAPNEGVRFLGWIGDVTEEDAGKTSLTFEINEPMSLTPQLLADFMVYEGGFLTDGMQNYKASGAANAIQLDGVVTTLSNGVVDVTKPIVGGTLTKIKDMFCNWCDASTKFTIYEMYLPETITYFGARAFDCSTIIKTVEPLFPRDVTYVGYSIFAGARALTGNVTIGYATDEQGKPKTVSFGKTGGDVRSFLNIGAIYSVRLGPGVMTAPQGLIDSAGATTNIVIDGVAAMEGSVFKGLGKCDVTFTADMPTWTSSPFSLAANKNYLQRYYLPWEGGKKHPLWGAYIRDGTKVKPWKALTAEEKALYRTKFPNEPRSAHPFGLTLSGGILPANQWVFAPYRVGFALLVK